MKGPDGGPDRVRSVLVGCAGVLAVPHLVLIFGDFGFDRGGRFGLAFGHLLLVGLAGVLTTTIGVGTASGYRRWRWAVGLLLLGCGLLPAAALGDVVSLHLYR